MQRMPPPPLQRVQSSQVTSTTEAVKKPRSRASTIQVGTALNGQPTLAALLPVGNRPPLFENDIFESQEQDEAQAEDAGNSTSKSFEELPIEIQSLSERFLESLSAPVHPGPLGIDALSQLFQDFYERAESHIATHIATLSLRMSRASKSSREQSPAPSVASSGSGGPRKRQNSIENRKGELQMVTATEITDRRKARRQLELQRIALEEAVERGVCEKVYPRLWQHRSTDDEEKDQKLRSRAAALSVVGVGLKELLTTEIEDTSGDGSEQDSTESDDLVRAQFAKARYYISCMNDERYPLGKLNHLISAHKSVVDSLSKLFPAISSADEILPTLIYTIITSPPENLQVISNLNFIQRFRAAGKISGEAAYCLTNLEASIAFLETVDLAAIRKGEQKEGPSKNQSAASTPRNEISDPMYRAFPADEVKPGQDLKGAKATPESTENAPGQGSRRFSQLRQMRQRPLELASSTMINGADLAMDTIQGAMDGSFKFLFGRLREKQAAAKPDSNHEIVVPRTLDEARKLVNSPPLTQNESNEPPTPSSASPLDESLSVHKTPEATTTVLTTRRDRSVDSARSSGSSKAVSFVETKPTVPGRSRGNSAKSGAGANLSSMLSPVPVGQAAAESMRYLGTLNPLNRLGSISMLPRFGKSAGTSTPPTATTPVGTESGNPLARGSTLPDSGATTLSPSVFDLSGVAPPISRFVDIKDPKELNLFEVELLLTDYQRLAGALTAARAAQAAQAPQDTAKGDAEKPKQ